MKRVGIFRSPALIMALTMYGCPLAGGAFIGVVELQFGGGLGAELRNDSHMSRCQRGFCLSFMETRFE